MLNIHDSTLVWARVYFYAIVGTLASSAFLASPGKAWLAQKVKAHTKAAGKGEPGGKPGLGRVESSGSLMDGATLGVPSEPGKEWDEMVEEVMEEVKKRRGSKPGPEGVELRRLVEDTLHRTTSGEGGGKKEL